MANLKNITEVPVLESLDGTEKVLLNAGGSAKQANINLIKPAEEWDLDLNITTAQSEDGEFNYDENTVFVTNDTYSFDSFVTKFHSGEQLKTRVCWNFSFNDGQSSKTFVTHMVQNYIDVDKNSIIYLLVFNPRNNEYWWIYLEQDGTFWFD